MLIDTSGSMKGAPIDAVNKGLVLLVDALKVDPDMVETAYLSILTFDRDVKEVLPLTELERLEKVPVLVTPESSPTHMGKALEVLIEKVEKDIIRNTAGTNGDYKPLLFVITDGKPSDLDLYNRMTKKIKECKFGVIVACAAGPKAKTEPLMQLTDKDKICILSDMDEKSFANFFLCVSQSIPISNWEWTPIADLSSDIIPGRFDFIPDEEEDEDEKKDEDEGE